MNFLSTLFAAVIMAVGLARSQVFSPTFNLIAGPSFHSGPNLVEFAQPAAGPRSLAHHAVVENAAQEAQLPPELLNPFYKNPLIAAGLAKESLITNKEFAVFNRDTEKIARSEILKIFRNAGFHDKNRRK
ncbi:hypothetical protein ILUMI_20698 [Ignelater luminosus]|uniref:Uncharacterized protein n=1 Tax=Ignelater luminosus TaxID=2038154 RepID=A0A8K0CDM4_IGNLU|nr:hypothetical protein ILUMI_20698 [Ignelater luminosus]